MYIFPYKEENNEAAEIAKKNGCSPRFNDDYELWCCLCEDGQHQGDLQCSVIDMVSAWRAA